MATQGESRELPIQKVIQGLNVSKVDPPGAAALFHRSDQFFFDAFCIEGALFCPGRHERDDVGHAEFGRLLDEYVESFRAFEQRHTYRQRNRRLPHFPPSLENLPYSLPARYMGEFYPIPSPRSIDGLNLIAFPVPKDLNGMARFVFGKIRSISRNPIRRQVI